MVGFATGFEIVVLLNPVAGDQAKVPFPAPLSVVFEPVQIETSGPALAEGDGFTVADVVPAAPVHPLTVAVTE